MGSPRDRLALGVCRPPELRSKTARKRASHPDAYPRPGRTRRYHPEPHAERRAVGGAVVPSHWRPSGRGWCVVGSATAILVGSAFGAAAEHQVNATSSKTPAISLVVDKHRATSLVFHGTADTSASYNAFVEVRVFQDPQGGLKLVGTSGQSRVGKDGPDGGTIAFRTTLPAGRYYAQASQGWGQGAGHAQSTASGS